MAEIRPLAADVAAQILAGHALTSLSDVVLGLVRNSLDAQARSISVSVDFGRASCIVEDDGEGIARAEFEHEGGLGQAHHTSRHGTQNHVYGGQGLFLSQVAALSIATICSRRHGQEANALIWRHGCPVVRLVPSPAHLEPSKYHHGTRVVVQDLFGIIPVRVRQRPVGDANSGTREREWTSLRRRLTGLLLAWARPVEFCLRGTDESHRMRICHVRSFTDKAQNGQDSKITQTPQAIGLDLEPPIQVRSTDFDRALAETILCQAYRDVSLNVAGWTPISVQTSRMTLNGLIALIPSPTKKLQHLSLGIHQVTPDECWGCLYDEINQRLLRSYFGADEPFPAGRTGLQKGVSTAQHPRRRMKGVDKWPTFYIRVEKADSTNAFPGSVTPDSAGSLHVAISDVLATAIDGFLGKHSLLPSALCLRTKHSGNEKADLQRSNSVDEPVAHPNTQRTATLRLRDLGRRKIAPKKQVDTASSSRNAFSTWRTVKVGVSRQQIAGLGPRTVSAPLYIKPRKAVDEVCQSEDQSYSSRPTTLTGQVRWTDSTTKRTYTVDPLTGHTTIDQGATDDPSRSRRITRTKSDQPVRPRADSWTNRLFEDWENPVFQPKSPALPRISGGTAHNLTDAIIPQKSDLSDTTQRRILEEGVRKVDLHHVRVIAQVDCKFILIQAARPASPNESKGQLLLLVDQHAADERVRVEDLLQDYCQPASENQSSIVSPLGFRSSIQTALLPTPVVFEVDILEAGHFRCYARHFARWGILYGVSEQAHQACHQSDEVCPQVSIISLPPVIAERCRTEPRLLIGMLRTEVWRAETKAISPSGVPPSRAGHDAGAWLTQIRGCPPGLLDLIYSRACRSAIMFNDVLSHSQCEDLIRRLAHCICPFQCAHGRPSMTPVVHLANKEPSTITEHLAESIDKVRSGEESEAGLPRSGQCLRDSWLQWSHE